MSIAWSLRSNVYRQNVTSGLVVCHVGTIAFLKHAVRCDLEQLGLLYVAVEFSHQFITHKLNKGVLHGFSVVGSDAPEVHM
jgi:hypothetical protein